jgi:uncharacterized membrane protein YeaQ/YmgE (transglycosylase-associated protein family)
MHGLIFWIVVGIIAGALAKAVVPGQAGRGWFGDLILGLVGALLGGWLFNTFAGHSYGGPIGSTFVAFVGAVVLLVIGRALSGNRRAV